MGEDTIVYENYMFMAYNEEDQKNYANPNVIFTDYLRWLLDADFVQLTDMIVGTFELKCMPNRADDAIIEGMIPKTLKEWNKKIKISIYAMLSHL